MSTNYQYQQPIDHLISDMIFQTGDEDNDHGIQHNLDMEEVQMMLDAVQDHDFLLTNHQQQQEQSLIQPQGQDDRDGAGEDEDHHEKRRRLMHGSSPVVPLMTMTPHQPDQFQQQQHQHYYHQEPPVLTFRKPRHGYLPQQTQQYAVPPGYAYPYPMQQPVQVMANNGYPPQYPLQQVSSRSHQQQLPIYAVHASHTTATSKSASTKVSSRIGSSTKSSTTQPSQTSSTSSSSSTESPSVFSWSTVKYLACKVKGIWEYGTSTPSPPAIASHFPMMTTTTTACTSIVPEIFDSSEVHQELHRNPYMSRAVSEISMLYRTWSVLATIILLLLTDLLNIRLIVYFCQFIRHLEHVGRLQLPEYQRDCHEAYRLLMRILTVFTTHIHSEQDPQRHLLQTMLKAWKSLLHCLLPGVVGALSEFVMLNLVGKWEDGAIVVALFHLFVKDDQIIQQLLLIVSLLCAGTLGTSSSSPSASSSSSSTALVGTSTEMVSQNKGFMHSSLWYYGLLGAFFAVLGIFQCHAYMVKIMMIATNQFLEVFDASDIMREGALSATVHYTTQFAAWSELLILLLDRNKQDLKLSHILWTTIYHLCRLFGEGMSSCLCALDIVKYLIHVIRVSFDTNTTSQTNNIKHLSLLIQCLQAITVLCPSPSLTGVFTSIDDDEEEEENEHDDSSKGTRGSANGARSRNKRSNTGRNTANKTNNSFRSAFGQVHNGLAILQHNWDQLVTRSIRRIHETYLKGLEAIGDALISLIRDCSANCESLIVSGFPEKLILCLKEICLKETAAVSSNAHGNGAGRGDGKKRGEKRSRKASSSGTSSTTDGNAHDDDTVRGEGNQTGRNGEVGGAGTESLSGVMHSCLRLMEICCESLLILTQYNCWSYSKQQRRPRLRLEYSPDVATSSGTMSSDSSVLSDSASMSAKQRLAICSGSNVADSSSSSASTCTAMVRSVHSVSTGTTWSSRSNSSTRGGVFDSPFLATTHGMDVLLQVLERRKTHLPTVELASALLALKCKDKAPLSVIDETNGYSSNVEESFSTASTTRASSTQPAAARSTGCREWLTDNESFVEAGNTLFLSLLLYHFTCACACRGTTATGCGSCSLPIGASFCSCDGPRFRTVTASVHSTSTSSSRSAVVKTDSMVALQTVYHLLTLLSITLSASSTVMIQGYLTSLNVPYSMRIPNTTGVCKLGLIDLLVYLFVVFVGEDQKGTGVDTSGEVDRSKAMLKQSLSHLICDMLLLYTTSTSSSSPQVTCDNNNIKAIGFAPIIKPRQCDMWAKAVFSLCSVHYTLSTDSIDSHQADDDSSSVSGSISSSSSLAPSVSISSVSVAQSVSVLASDKGLVEKVSRLSDVFGLTLNVKFKHEQEMMLDVEEQQQYDLNVKDCLRWGRVLRTISQLLSVHNESPSLGIRLLQETLSAISHSGVLLKCAMSVKHIEERSIISDALIAINNRLLAGLAAMKEAIDVDREAMWSLLYQCTSVLCSVSGKMTQASSSSHSVHSYSTTSSLSVSTPLSIAPSSIIIELLTQLMTLIEQEIGSEGSGRNISFGLFALCDCIDLLRGHNKALLSPIAITMTDFIQRVVVYGKVVETVASQLKTLLPVVEEDSMETNLEVAVENVQAWSKAIKRILPHLTLNPSTLPSQQEEVDDDDCSAALTAADARKQVLLSWKQSLQHAMQSLGTSNTPIDSIVQRELLTTLEVVDYMIELCDVIVEDVEDEDGTNDYIDGMRSSEWDESCEGEGGVLVPTEIDVPVTSSINSTSSKTAEYVYEFSSSAAASTGAQVYSDCSINSSSDHGVTSHSHCSTSVDGSSSIEEEDYRDLLMCFPLYALEQDPEQA